MCLPLAWQQQRKQQKRHRQRPRLPGDVGGAGTGFRWHSKSLGGRLPMAAPAPGALCTRRRPTAHGDTTERFLKHMMCR